MLEDISGSKRLDCNNKFNQEISRIPLEQPPSRPVSPEVSLRNPVYTGNKGRKWGFHSYFETLGWCHQKSKLRVPVAPRKGLMSSKNLTKICQMWQEVPCVILIWIIKGSLSLCNFGSNVLFIDLHLKMVKICGHSVSYSDPISLWKFIMLAHFTTICNHLTTRSNTMAFCHVAEFVLRFFKKIKTFTLKNSLFVKKTFYHNLIATIITVVIKPFHYYLRQSNHQGFSPSQPQPASASASTTSSRASATMFFSQLPVNKRKSKPKSWQHMIYWLSLSTVPIYERC